jgi:predicted O-linked N-acetylglucosamine transferase (SPINDLY family)
MVTVETPKPFRSLLITESTPTIHSNVDDRYQIALAKHRTKDFSGAESFNNSVLVNNTEHFFRQGCQLFAQERFHEANRAFHQAASFPGGQELWRWKSLGFCPTIMYDELSIIRYWQQLDHGLDLALQSNISIDWRRLPFDGFTPSFNLPHHGNNCRSIKEKFAQIFTKGFPQDRPKLKNTMRNRTRIRLGFITMAGHHRGFLRVFQSLLQKLNPDKFEIVFISPLSIQNSCKNLICRNDIIWLGLNDRFDDSVAKIRDAQCDLVYHWKIGGCPFDYFLPFAKLAPIQCTSLGTHVTSGIPVVDYYLSSSFLETSESQRYYTERLILLDSYPTAHVPEPTHSATRQELHLPEKGSLYFCPHRLAKYHPRFDLYLKQILERDQTGYLVLLTGNRPQLAKIFSERIHQNLGEDLFRRVILYPLLSLEQYRKFYSVVTCVLDSPAYAGDLTAHDALEYNVPIVTQQGALLVQRYTSGLYRMMNMDSFIADSEENYINLAIRLGTDVDYNTTIRQTIAERKEAIFDIKSFIREYEHFFERAINSFDVSII